MPVVKFAKTGTAPESTSWNWDAATQNAILGAGKDWARYKEAHTAFDGSGTPTTKEPYHLPHHRMGAGGLEAVWRGVANAMARLASTSLSEEEMRGAHAHLAAHYAQWGKKPPEAERVLELARMYRAARAEEAREGEREQERAAQVLPPQVDALARTLAFATTRILTSTSAPLVGRPHVGAARATRATATLMQAPLLTAHPSAVLLATRATLIAPQVEESATSATPSLARPGGKATEEDMTRINRLARTPLTPEQAYVVSAQISSQKVDSYYTAMTPLTLARFAAAASRGVAFCDSHEHGRLPMGRLFYGQVAPDPTLAGSKVTQAQAYMLRGLPLSNGLNSDDVIRGIEGGIYDDVSVGFLPEHFWCSICGKDMMNDPECSHVPGVRYPVRSSSGNTDALCIAEVDADLGELSLVYHHATPDAALSSIPTGQAGRALAYPLGAPNAMLLKAERLISSGFADPQVLRFVEDTCRVPLLTRYSMPTTPVPAAVSA